MPEMRTFTADEVELSALKLLGEVVHLVARKLADLSGDLASVGR
jgi:hypothetical protein